AWTARDVGQINDLYRRCVRLQVSVDDKFEQTHPVRLGWSMISRAAFWHCAGGRPNAIRSIETPRVHHAARRRISTSKLQAGRYSLCDCPYNSMGKCCHGHDPKITRVPTEWSHSLEVHLRGRRCLAATCMGGCPQRRFSF